MDPKLSVCVITYNHAKFISKALDSVLNQQANFNYEIVVGEDCSRDGTRDIVLDYHARYPDRFRLQLPEKNLGMMLNFIRTLQACRGQYIALCEGDDYWTAVDKLQTQVNFLDDHLDFAICSHNVLVKYEDGEHPDREWPGSEQRCILALEDLLRDGSGGATCSLVFRNKIFEIPDWYYTVAGGDWALQVLCASHGKLRYFPKVMGVYRRHEHGAVYAQTASARARGEAPGAIASENSLEICDALDKHFDYRHTKHIQRQKAYWYWTGGLDRARRGDVRSARTSFLKAMRGILPPPRGLSTSALLKGLLFVLLPPRLSLLLSRPFYNSRPHTV